MKDKTELKIAKKNIRNLEKNLPELTQANISEMIIEHKQTCKRFLGFLKNIRITWLKFEDNTKCDNKIKDLQETIKIYDENLK